MRNHVPTDAQLAAALASIQSDIPGIGAKKILQELKQRFPTWHISAKRVRETLGEPTAPDSEGDGGFFEQRIAAFYALARTGTRLPVSRYHTKAEPTLPVAMLRALGTDSNAFVCGLEAFRPRDAEAPPPDPHTAALYLPFRLFRAEWHAYLGPPDALPPAAPHEDGVEAALFPELFPFGIGSYKSQENLSFEEYAFHRLRQHNAGFRSNLRWLQWALTQTQDPDLVVALNCVLVVKYGVKCRHIGGPQVHEVAAVILVRPVI